MTAIYFVHSFHIGCKVDSIDHFDQFDRELVVARDNKGEGGFLSVPRGFFYGLF